MNINHHNTIHKYEILIIDDEPGNLYPLRLNFSNNYLVREAINGEEALKILKKNSQIMVVITDQRMPEMTGIEFLKHVRKTHPDAIRIIITGFHDISIVEDAINKIGIHRLFYKPMDEKSLDDLNVYIRDALIKYELERENKYLCEELREVYKNNSLLRRLFSKFIPPKIIRMLENKGKIDTKITRDTEKKRITILYIDIIGFTSLCEQLDPQKIVQILNEYLGSLSQVIIENGGTIDKYIGDAIMATFGVIDPDQEGPKKEAEKAIKCAIKIKETLIDFNKSNDTFPDLHIGIGINTGEVVVGIIGPESRWDYTVIGDAVNRASRIEHLTREYNKSDAIFIGDETFAMVRDIIEYVDFGLQKIRGSKTDSKIYEVLKLK